MRGWHTTNLNLVSFYCMKVACPRASKKWRSALLASIQLRLSYSRPSNVPHFLFRHVFHILGHLPNRLFTLTTYFDIAYNKNHFYCWAVETFEQPSKRRHGWFWTSETNVRDYPCLFVCFLVSCNIWIPIASKVIFGWTQKALAERHDIREQSKRRICIRQLFSSHFHY